MPSIEMRMPWRCSCAVRVNSAKDDAAGLAISDRMAASRSRIVDADYAVETAKLAQQQILQDATTAMLAQAHSVVAEQALALLKDV